MSNLLQLDFPSLRRSPAAMAFLLMAGILEAKAQAPTVELSAAEAVGGVVVDPFLDVDIAFSAPVGELAVGQVVIAGDAAPSHATLTPLPGGTDYRLRVAGFPQAGPFWVQVPAGVVTGVAPAEANAASPLLSLEYAPPVYDDLASLSDEFDDAATLASWLRNDTAEGWNADKLEQWNIDGSVPGHMRLMPYSSSWYQDFAGVLVYREVEGDFVATLRLDVRNRAGTGRPNSDFSLAGILIRSPRGVSAAAPQPDPGPGTVLPWPPPAPEQPGHYATDWAPGTENYIFLSYGFGSVGMAQPDGANTNRWHYEVKTTSNSVSTLYPRTNGVPENEPNATLQIVRRGGTFLLLRRHGGWGWIIENRFERPDMPATLQVGITTYTDWNTIQTGWDFASPVQPYHQNRIVNDGIGTPDLVADADYFRLRRPDPALDAAVLQSVAVTGEGAWGGIILLADTAIAAYLGDSAGQPAEDTGSSYPQWLGQHLDPAQLADPGLTDPAASLGGSGLPSALHFLMGGDPLASAPWPGATDFEEGEVGPRLRVPRNPQARGWELAVDTSTNLLHGWSAAAASVDGGPAVGPGLEGEIHGDPPQMLVGPAPGQQEAGLLFFRARASPLP